MGNFMKRWKRSLEIAGQIRELKNGNYYSNAAAIKALTEIGLTFPEEVIPALIEVLKNGYDDTNENIIQIFTEIGLASLQAISILIEILKKGDEYYSHAIIARTLGRIGMASSGAIPLLIEALRKDKNDLMRKAAADALGKINPASLGVIPALTDALKKDENYLVRMAATYALGGIKPPPPEATTVLIEALKKDESFLVRAAAIYAIGKMSLASQAIPVLMDALKDESHSVRMVAAHTLGHMGPASSKAIPLLIEVLRKDENDLVRETVTHALGEIDPLLYIAECLFASDIQKENLLSFITLGAKLYPGQNNRRLFEPTIDPNILAQRIMFVLGKPGELQISVGFDTGKDKHKNRSKFISLAFFIISSITATPDSKKHFASLKEAPKRDPEAAYGLIIRGIEISRISAINLHACRIDYLFQVGADIKEENLAWLISFLQYLNLGLLLTAAYSKYQCPDGYTLAPHYSAIIKTYQDFEQELVKILRKYNSLVNPDAVYKIPGQEKENKERGEALNKYLLEECLYPDKEWLINLYEDNNSWFKLLPYLRAIEAVILHREAEERETPLGDQFIDEVRRLIFNKATDIKFILEDKKNPPPASIEEKDPFIDFTDFPYYTQRYLETGGKT